MQLYLPKRIALPVFCSDPLSSNAYATEEILRGITAAVRKNFLFQDFRQSLEGQIRVDCRLNCFACGILPKFNEMRSNTPAEAWKCPPVKPRLQRLRQATRG